MSHNGSFGPQMSYNGSFGGPQNPQGGSFAGQPRPDPAPPPIQNITGPPSAAEKAPKKGQRGRQRAADRGPAPVKKMQHTDTFGDSGLYTGAVDSESLPHGTGFMKYDNGIYYEGEWVHGRKDDSKGMASSQTRDRILGGFTSWKSARSRSNSRTRGGKDDGCKADFVYGMDWVDVMGRPGKYTGEVSSEDEPNGQGVMRYEMGLVAEGDWIKGVLNDGSGITRANAAATVAGGMSVAPGGMSIAPGEMSVAGGAGGGAMTVVSGLGMMSIGGSGMMAHPAMMGMGQQPHFSYPRMQMQMQQPHPGGPPPQAAGQGMPMYGAPPHQQQQQQQQQQQF